MTVENFFGWIVPILVKENTEKYYLKPWKYGFSLYYTRFCVKHVRGKKKNNQVAFFHGEGCLLSGIDGGVGASWEKMV